MNAVARCLAAALFALCAAQRLAAQDLAPRAYLITPVNGNAITLSDSRLDGSIQFSGALPITGATANVNLPVFSYYRSFDLLGRSANVALAVPYGIGDFEGTVVGVPRFAHRSGTLDSVLRLSVNLIGGPAMDAAEFVKWRQKRLLGVSLKIVAPTGQYDPTRLINWGNNRWAFKPEIGYSERWGHWVLDAYAAVWFFTRNPEFYVHNVRTEQPVPAFESHLSRDFGGRMWFSIDANFWSGGETSLNGVPNRLTVQRSSRVGATASLPITARQSIKLSFSNGAYIRYGGNYRDVTLAWQYAWLD